MHQFEVQKMFDMFHVGNHEVAFTTSAMWMVIAGLLLWVFMIGGMKRQLVPGRWQVAVEGFTGFISSMMNANIGPEGRKYTPYVFSLFRSEEHTSELQSLMRISYAVFCLKKKKINTNQKYTNRTHDS